MVDFCKKKTENGLEITYKVKKIIFSWEISDAKE